MQWLNIITKVADILTSPELQAAWKVLADFVKSLSESEQVAYLSKFEALGGYGCPLNPDCPDCPPEAKPAEEAILEALAA